MRAIVMACVLPLGVGAQEYSLTCGQVFDAREGKLLGPHVIEVRDQRIAEVRAGARATAERIDLSDQTCLPGLIDLHVHLEQELTQRSYLERFQLNAADLALRASANARRTLEAGFTTVRNLGDTDNVTVALRNAIDAGIVIGPRIATAAKSIATTGGHADPSNGRRRDLAGEPGPLEGVIDGADEARKAVRQRYKDGADLIKITATGGVLSPAKNSHNPQFTDAELRAVVETAADYGMHVAAHAHGAEGMKRAIAAGVRTIEHGTLMDEEVMRLMADRGVYLVPTLMAGEWVSQRAAEPGYFPEIVRVKAAAIGPLMADTFRRAHAAGVPIAFGTDSGVSSHGENAREFELMVAAGMPPAQAIRSATAVAAEVLGREDIGLLEQGRLADIIAVPSNPLDDIRTLGKVSFVMKGGARIR